MKSAPEGVDVGGASVADLVGDPRNPHEHDRRDDASPMPLAVKAVGVLAGYEVCAVSVNTLLGEPVLPSLTTWLQRPWRPAMVHTAGVAANGLLVGGLVVAGGLIAVVVSRRSP